MPNDSVVVKPDFSNAFNCLHRSDMLKSIADWVPELLSYCHSAYANPSVLYYGQYIIMSQEGPQQGDPLGPLLFCNTIHPLLESLDSVLRLGYLCRHLCRLSENCRKGRLDSNGGGTRHGLER